MSSITKEDLARIIREEVETAVEKSGLTAPRRDRPIPGAGTEAQIASARHGIRLDKQHWGDYFRAALLGVRRNVPDTVVKALSEGSDSAGGYLVPEDFRAEVIQRLPELSELYPHVRKLPTGRDSVKFPKLDTDVQMSWDEGESTAFDESTPSFDQISFSIHRCNAMTKTSRELLGDAAFDLAEYLQQLFSEAYAAELDRVIAVGDGSDEPEGIYSASGITAVAVDGALTADDLIEIYHTVPKKYRKGARWMMTNTNVERIRKLKDQNDQYLWRPGLEGGQPDTLFGKYICEQEDLPDTWIGFGDLSCYRILQREEFGFESSTTAGTAFEKHELWLKCWARMDGKIVLPAAFAKGTGITG